MIRKRPFRFGVTAIEGATSREEWRTKARSIEDAGYATLVIPDHLVTLFSPIAALQSDADTTHALRVGSFVLDNVIQGGFGLIVKLSQRNECPAFVHYQHQETLHGHTCGPSAIRGGFHPSIFS